jgi:nucleoside-diphosphate kinase
MNDLLSNKERAVNKLKALMVCLVSFAYVQAKEPVCAPELETTFAFIKPDAVKAKNTGQIIALVELNKFTVVHMQKLQLSKKQAESFYAEHKDKHFFNDLISYMTSGPVVALALQKKDAISEWRQLMGATDPLKAEPGTMRRMFGTDKTHNAVHGSDSSDSALRELMLFFPHG